MDRLQSEGQVAYRSLVKALRLGTPGWVSRHTVILLDSGNTVVVNLGSACFATARLSVRMGCACGATHFQADMHSLKALDGGLDAPSGSEKT